jgi:phosphonate transport system permease protein
MTTKEGTMATATPERIRSARRSPRNGRPVPRERAERNPTLDPRDRERMERAFTVPRARFLLGLPIVGLLLVWSFVGAEFNFAKLGEGAINMGDFLARLFPPTWDKFGTIVELLIETLQMAIVGTALGAVLSLIVAFGAASNIAPRWLYYPTRWIMNVIRSLPDLVFALMFVSAVGLGPFAGILAMTLGSIGSIGKVFAEAMEAVDDGPVTAMRAVGASRRQVVQYGILPQSAPLLVSYTLLLFEGNVRGATILGMVGAGGIGLELTTAMKMYDYGHLSAIVICIIVLVTVIDQASAIIRKKIT